MKVPRRPYRYLNPYKPWALAAFGSMIVFALTQTVLAALVQPLFDNVLTPPGMQRQVSSAEKPSATQRVLNEHVLRRDVPEGERGFPIDTIDRAKNRFD